MRKKFTHPAITDLDGNQITLLVKTSKIVCPCCNGEGTTFRRDLDESKLVESMAEDGDYDALDSYYKGAYDEICSMCNGRNVIDAISWDWFANEYPKEYKDIQDYTNQEREDMRYAAQERRYLGY